MAHLGWISEGLGMQIWTEMEEASRAAMRVRKRKWPEGPEGAEAAGEAPEEPPMLARYDPMLHRLLSSRPSHLFKLVVQALLHPQIQPPVDVSDVMEVAELAEWLKQKHDRHWEKEAKRQRRHFDVARHAQRQWRDEAQQARDRIGLKRAEGGLVPYDNPPLLSSRSALAGTPAALGPQRGLAPPDGTPAVWRAGAKPEAPRRARSLSPSLELPHWEAAHSQEFRAVYREKVEAVLEQLAELQGRPVTLERLDLGNRRSLLVVEVRKAVLYGAFNSVLHHRGEPLIAVAAEAPRVPEPAKTHAVIQGYEDGSITFLTRPEEDQVRREVQQLLDCPSVEGGRQREVDWRVRLVLNHRPVSDSFNFKRFHWQAVTPFAEFCPKGTVDDCIRDNVLKEECDKIHFRRLIFAHTDIELGDCSYLDTCRRLNICKFVHYQLMPSRGLVAKLRALQGIEDDGAVSSRDIAENLASIKGLPTSHWQNDYRGPDGRIKPLPIGMRITPWLQAQWIQCDIRTFDLSALGKFDVIMADPPWDIHMELPYGTMRDAEMREMPVGSLSDEGLIFLWVTGRAMELGRECLEIWGYRILEEIVWVKINQLQRIIRTGRTGHWLNHSKEHCLVGIKGNPKINKCLDCDVIVSEVRETSRKPDEIYGIIERICPDGRKLEMFARNHNIHEGWVALGNQLDGVHLTEPQLLENYNNWVAKEMARRKREAREKELRLLAREGRAREAEPQPLSRSPTA